MVFIFDMFRYTNAFTKKSESQPDDEDGEEDGEGSGDIALPSPDSALSYVLDSFQLPDEETDAHILDQTRFERDIRAALRIFWNTMMPAAMLERINKKRETVGLPSLDETIELLPEGAEISDYEPATQAEIKTERRSKPRHETHDR